MASCVRGGVTVEDEETSTCRKNKITNENWRATKKLLCGI